MLAHGYKSRYYFRTHRLPRTDIVGSRAVCLIGAILPVYHFEVAVTVRLVHFLEVTVLSNRAEHGALLMPVTTRSGTLKHTKLRFAFDKKGAELLAVTDFTVPDKYR